MKNVIVILSMLISSTIFAQDNTAPSKEFMNRRISVESAPGQETVHSTTIKAFMIKNMEDKTQKVGYGRDENNNHIIRLKVDKYETLLVFKEHKDAALLISAVGQKGNNIPAHQLPATMNFLLMVMDNDRIDTVR